MGALDAFAPGEGSMDIAGMGSPGVRFGGVGS